MIMMFRRQQNLLALVLLLLANAVSSAAAQLISHRYDGVYLGATELSSEISQGACPRLPLTRLEIRNGILRAYDHNGRQIVKGIMTGDGFFNADYIFTAQASTPFEGMADRNGRLTGAVTVGDCVWIVELQRRD